ncbi:MAG TPA: tyrosine-type recombinase/integrase [Planctomycetota bacterium]|nr:tyrosine-type recombinase/integrase [Planctomycetota bacterium]
MGRVYKPTRKAIGTDGAQVVIEYDAFYIEFTDSCGRTRRRKAGLTAAAAKDALRQAESEVLAEKNGLPTRKAGEILLSEMLTAYLQTLRQHVTERHADSTETAIENMLAAMRCAFLKDLKPERIEGYLAGLQETGKLSARSINAPLVAIKSMLNWAVQTRRIPYNPLTCIKATIGEKKRKRRALSEAEIGALLAAALDGPTRRNLHSRQNRPRKDKTFKPVKMPTLLVQAKLASEGRNAALLYRLMLEAGLRLNEARCLTWADLDLDAKTMRLRAETTKNGKAETLPLAPALLAALEARKKELKPAEGAPVVHISSRVLKQLNNDLTAAEIEKKDAAGRTVDLHALRHTFGTRLNNNGADVKTIQALMRHSTAAMTLGVYIHKSKNQMTAAVESLPAIAPAARKETAAALKTGTDNAPVSIFEGNPLHNRHTENENYHKGNEFQGLQKCAIETVTQKVGGSNPLSHPSTSRRAFSPSKAFEIA